MKKLHKILLVVLSAFLLAGVILFTPAISVLSISARKNPDQVYFSKAAVKDGFCISYTHSVNKGRVHDYYLKTTDNKLEMERTVFVSYGAGIPEPEETPGAQFTVLENGYQISNLHRIVPQLVMAVGIIANHSFAIGNNVNNSHEYFFTDFFEPQTSIILKINKLSVVKYLQKKNKIIDYIK